MTDNLQGNKLIEADIALFYKAQTEEHLAKVLSTIRSRRLDAGHFVIAVKPGENNQMDLRTITTPDGRKWFAAFTSFDEELKKSDPIVSGFTAEIGKLFETAMSSHQIAGIILNPWDKAIKLDKGTIELLV